MHVERALKMFSVLLRNGSRYCFSKYLCRSTVQYAHSIDGPPTNLILTVMLADQVYPHYLEKEVIPKHLLSCIHVAQNQIIT